jgi:WXG100 family type VII secretion target
MGANITQAEYDTLDNIATRFAGQAETVDAVRLRMDHHVQALRNGGWQGRGSAAFFAEMDSTVFPAVLRLNQALQEARAVTLQIKDILQAAEEEAAEPFRNGAYDKDNSGKPGKLDEKTRISEYQTDEGDLFVTGPGDGQTHSIKLPGWLGGQTITFESGKIHPNDVAQGQLRNCFLITSLAVVAHQNPGLIENAIKDNGDGTYTVTFYEKGGGFLGIGDSYQPVNITVTPEFPVREVYDKETGKWVADGQAPHAGMGDNELWPRILEKAYAQWQGDGDITRGYQKLNKGGQSQDVFEALAGTDSQSTTNMSQYSLSELAQMHKSGTAITLSSLNTTSNGGEGYYNAGSGKLHTTHAYWVESVDVANDKIVVRNPWGYESSPKYRIELSYAEFKQKFDRIDTNSLQQ